MFRESAAWVVAATMLASDCEHTEVARLEIHKTIGDVIKTTVVIVAYLVWPMLSLHEGEIHSEGKD